MRGLKQPLLHLENRITKGCRGINSPDRKRKAVGQKRHDSMQVDERYILRRVEIGTAYFDWPWLRWRTKDTSAKSSSPEGGICCFRLKTMSVTPYMMLVPPTANPTAGKYAARYSTSLNPKLNNELFVFERWNYCAGAAMLLHTILSLKQIWITKKQGDIRNVWNYL